MTDLQPRNILVMILGQLGDVVLALPALSVIRSGFPGAKITILSASTTSEILEISNVCDEIIVVDRRALRTGSIISSVADLLALARDVRRRKFDLVVDLHSLYETNILGFLSGAPKRLFANRENRSIDALSNFRPRPSVEDKSLHKSVYYLNVLRPLGISGPPIFHLPVPPAERPDEIDALRNNSISEKIRPIGLFVGAGHPGRKWPLERFAELANRLDSGDHSRIFVILGPEEEQLEQSIEAQFPSTAVIVKGLSIRQLLVFISKLDLFIGNDTGPSHLSSIIGTPTVMIMRSDYDRRFTPLGDITVYVASGPVDEITVDEAYEAAKQMLETPGST
jgi:heptosyltransferase-1